MRILVLGDSFVQALQVPLQESFPKQLETRFQAMGHAVEVIAMGRAGVGPEHARGFYTTFGRKFSPDLVVWSLCDNNDITDSHPPLKELIGARRKRHFITPPRWLFPSICATFLYTRKWNFWDSSTESQGVFQGKFAKLGQLKRIHEVIYLKEWPPIFEEARQRFEYLLHGLIDEVHQDGLPLVAISVNKHYRTPQLRYPEFEWDPGRPEKIARDIVEARGATFLTMKPLFTQLRGQETLAWFRRDGHLNERGHQLVADALYEEILPRLRSMERKS